MQIVFCIIFRVWHCLSCTPTAKLSKLFYWHINKDQRANQRRKNNGETHTKRMWHDDGNERTKSNWFWNYCYKLNEDQMLCIVWFPENYSKISTIKWTAVMYSSLNVRNERSTHTHTHIDGIFNECKTFKWNCTNLFKTINIFTATTIYREMDLICSLVRIPFGLWRRWWWRSSKGEMEWLHSEVKLKT